MFLDKMGEFHEVAFLMEHLAAKLRLSHDPVKVWRNDPIKRSKRD